MKEHRIIVALDMETRDEVLRLAAEVAPFVSCVKIKPILCQKHPLIISELHCLGVKVFVDLKLHDDPNSVRQTVEYFSAMRADFFTIHASAGIEAMRQAVAASGRSIPIAVTVPTWLSEQNAQHGYGNSREEIARIDTLHACGIPATEIGQKVVTLAREAMHAGINTIVCSAFELKELARHREFDRLKKITAGIRPHYCGEAHGDVQKRKTSPQTAVEAGAWEFIVGNPITHPPKSIGTPAEAIRRISKDMALTRDAMRWRRRKNKTS